MIIQPNKKTVERRRREGGIRAIDTGTCLDVMGRLRRLQRQIEQGEYGAVTDIVFAVRGIDKGIIDITCYGIGRGSTETHGYMAARLLDRIVG